MISYEEAYQMVLTTAMHFGNEEVFLKESHERILAEDIMADRDFPPFDRATKDGIALKFSAVEEGTKAFGIEGIAAAGSPQKTLKKDTYCLEIMTGAIVPKNADTVVMYEHLTIDNGVVTIEKNVSKGQNIHSRGSDEPQGSLLLSKGTKIEAAEIGVLASVGKSEVLVKKLPKIAVISTGDELVDVGETPLLHQIRKSNSHSLSTALKVEGVDANLLHINDKEAEIQTQLDKALKENDVLLLSGGVSKGKYDFLPEILERLGVKKHFHRVAQRPGKPFWFGQNKSKGTIVFAFPGNPASTFANYHIYFLPWLKRCLRLSVDESLVVLDEDFENATNLTRFIRAKVNLIDGQLKTTLVLGNGSGDLTSLSQSNGFVRFEANSDNKQGTMVPFYPTKRVL